MKILIIGGSRFVGPLIIERLLKNEHELSVFNRGSIQSNYGKEIKFIKGDRNLGFKQIDHNFDVVIDMCAYSGGQTQRAVEELEFDFFINLGSAASYKKTDTFPLTEQSSLGEWPLWGDYNRGKVKCEKILEQSKIKFATLRPVYVLGPKNYCDRELFIYSSIKKNLSILVPGNGTAKVQFTFSKDVAESIVKLAESKITGAFNCASDEVISLNTLVEEMGKIVGVKPVINHNPNAGGTGFKEEEFPFANETFYCDNSKLKKLGISFTPLIQGLKEDYESYYKKII